MDFSAFLTMLENLKAKAREFMDAISNLENIRSKTEMVPELEAERQRVYGAAGVLKSTIETIMGSVDASINWVRGMLGFPQDENVGNLEAFPVLAIGAVAAAVAALTKWLTDYLTFMKKFEAYEGLTAQGVEPNKAWKTAMQSTKVSFAAQLTKAFIPLVLIGGAFYLIPKIAPNLRFFR